MKTIKRLVLGSAAGLLAVGGAQAADLPVKANAVEYVKICTLYGAGFWYIPGTDTCMRIGGFLRIDTTFNGGLYDAPAWSAGLGTGDRFTDRINSRSRMGLTVDTRTATEYGIVRTFGQGDFQFNNFGSSNPSVIGAPATALGGLNGSLLNSVGGGYTGVEFVFVQFAGFTFGKSSSAFSEPWSGYPGNNTSFLIGGKDTITGVNNIQYTAEFGNGVSATVGLDDPTVFNRTPLYNLGVGAAGGVIASGAVSAAGVGSNAYGGWHMPDVVGNIRVGQAWGMFQFSAELHEVDASYNTLGAGGVAAPTSLLSGHPDTKYGGSVMTVFQIRNLPTGIGDDIKFSSTWAKGDTKNVISTSVISPTFLMLGGVAGQFGPAGSIGFGATSDGVYLPAGVGAGGVVGDGNIHLTTSYGVRGAFNHNWDPYWSSTLFGGMGWVRYDGTAQAEYCAAYGVTVPGQGATYSCNPNYSVSMLGTVTSWTPVRNLTLSAEAIWTHLNQSFSGSAAFSPGAPQPSQTWSYKNQDTLSLDVRVQRNF